MWIATTILSLMALSAYHASTMRPMSIEQIVQQAQGFEFVPNRTLKAWLRSAQMLLTEAAICEQDGNLQMAYLYLIRHAELVLGKLPTHPQYRDPGLKAEVAQAQRTVQRNLTTLERLKPRIQAEYERYLKARERRDRERERVQAERDDDQRQRWAEGHYESGVSGHADDLHDEHEEALNASEHRQLAVDLAHRELRRRDANKQSTRQAGISPGTVASRRQGIVVNDRSHDESSYDGIREAGQHLYPGRQASQQPGRAPQHTPSTAFHYPSVPAKEGVIDWRAGQHQTVTAGQPPSLAAKEPYQFNAAPPRPSKSGETRPPSPPPKSSAPGKSRYTFAPQASTEAGVPLRTVMLPPDLRTTFMNLAHANTARNLETCGILCGTVVSNALFISHLIIPDQHSTSDTCDTTESGDNALFDYCDAQNLLVCGWIHTHPSQSCFLSSRDLHTSSGYQVMLPEAIAIVCAPRHNPDWGIFRLTDPPGLPHVLKCEKTGLFHPHDEDRLYTDADGGRGRGHVVEAKGLEFRVVDLRGKT